MATANGSESGNARPAVLVPSAIAVAGLAAIFLLGLLDNPLDGVVEFELRGHPAFAYVEEDGVLVETTAQHNPWLRKEAAQAPGVLIVTAYGSHRVHVRFQPSVDPREALPGVIDHLSAAAERWSILEP